jgi:hypothetical protein
MRPKVRWPELVVAKGPLPMVSASALAGINHIWAGRHLSRRTVYGYAGVGRLANGEVVLDVVRKNEAQMISWVRVSSSYFR